jgi:hypothetical protein
MEEEEEDEEGIIHVSRSRAAFMGELEVPPLP